MFKTPFKDLSDDDKDTFYSLAFRVLDYDESSLEIYFVPKLILIGFPNLKKKIV